MEVESRSVDVHFAPATERRTLQVAHVYASQSDAEFPELVPAVRIPGRRDQTVPSCGDPDPTKDLSGLFYLQSF